MVTNSYSINKKVLLFGVLLAGTLLSSFVFHISLAHADVGLPAWWNGKVCDTNNYPGSHQQSSSSQYDGVIACGPGPLQGGTDHAVQFTGYTFTNYEWECVELSERFMDLVYGIAPYGAPGGKDIVSNYPGTILTKVNNNGASLPTPGDIFSASATAQNSYGHTGVITNVNVTNGSGTVSTVDQNNSTSGVNTISVSNNILQSNVTGWLHSSSSPSQDNTVLQVKKLTQSDGTNEVVWSKATDVNESWWRGSSGPSVGNLIHIPQGDIKSFDIELYPDNKHDLFVATAHNIWEVWWYPGQGLHTSANPILANIGNIKKIIKSHGPDGVTNQLYVLKDTGAYEYWWNSTSNGIQSDTIMTLANPVDEYKALEPDGSQALYIADQNYPYEQHWGNGINGFQQTTFSSISGITSISFSESSDNKHRLYVGSSSGAVWEASWYPNGSIGYWYMTGGSPVVQLQKYEDDSQQVIYEATNGGVFEYSWPTTSNTLSGRTIVGSLSSVHSFFRSTDPGNMQSVYTATGTNIFESWWPQGSNTITTGQIE